MELNDREIAGLFWTVLFFAVVLVKKDVRRVVGSVIQAFAQSVVLLALATATVWIIACVAALKQIGLWDWGNLKTTLVWGVTFAFVTMFDISRINEDRTYFGKTIRDIFGATVLITFVAELYSFSLPLELFLVPFLTFLAMLHVRTKTKPEYAVFGKLAGVILMVAWLGHFVYGLYRIATALDQVASNETLREFAAPILLSLFFLLFIYAFSVYVTYQSNFARLNWLLEDRNLRRRAKLRTVLAFGFNLDLLRRWSRESALARPPSDLEVKKIIRAIKHWKQVENRPPPVNPADGWSPFAAKELLAGQGLPTDDYHPSFEDEWYASSKMLELDDGLFPNNLAYYVEGDHRAVKRLKLKLNINNQDQAAGAEERLWAAAQELLHVALDGEQAQEAAAAIRSAETIDLIFDQRRVQLRREDFAGSRGGYSRTFKIEHASRGK